MITRLANDLLERFSVDFLPKRGMRQQAQRMFPKDDFGSDIIFLTPTRENKADRLVPPQAYPNYIEESIIIASIRKADLKRDPLLQFMVLHEIEHCTPMAFKVEAEPQRLRILAVATACAFLTGATYDATAVVCCLAYVFLLLFEAGILIPSQIETRTDLRALGKMQTKDAVAALQIRDRELRQKLAARDGPFIRRWFRKGTLGVFLHSSAIGSAKSFLDMNTSFGNLAGGSAVSRGVMGLGRRSLFGAALSYPATILMYVAASRTEAVASSISLIYYVLAPIILITASVVGTKAEIVRIERKTILDRMPRD